MGRRMATIWLATVSNPARSDLITPGGGGKVLACCLSITD